MILQLNAWWDVLVLFLIPIGGGIPGGVLLAQARGIPWPFMMILYFISDAILACAFEPLMKMLIFIGKQIPPVMKAIDFFRRSTQKSAARYGGHPSVLKLIGVSFMIDPMTGRAAAHMAGHGFVGGWLIAIAGDMIYFSVVMVSTLWMRSVLGDGTAALLVILVLMIGIPALVKKIRGNKEPARVSPEKPSP